MIVAMSSGTEWRAWLILAVSFASAPGCETIPSTKVDPYANNPITTRGLLRLPPGSIFLEGIDSVPIDIATVPCLRGKISLPGGQSFSDYVEAALLSELLLADRYANDATVSLHGALNEVSFSFDQPIGFASFGGTWTFSLIVRSSNGKEISVTSNYSYDTGYAPSRCHIAASYLMPAIQELIAKLVTEPNFAELLE